jgi:hypothetical protein
MAQIPHDDTVPHRAVIWLQAEVHELLSTGECAGTPITTIKRFPVFLDGQDRFMAERKLNDLLAEIKQKCR